MLWKKTWQPEVVMLLAGGILLSFFSANLAAELLRHYQVAGFQTANDAGNVFLATLGFHGAAIGLGVLFLKMQHFGWREVLGLDQPKWKSGIGLAVISLAAAVPVMISLKIISEFILQKLDWTSGSQPAIEMFANVKTPWLRVYLGVFTIVLAPVAEEFIFRGVIFSGLKKLGWTKTAWVGTSLLFALIHLNAPIFLPLFAFALVLTWIYQKTEGLLAPILAHSLFNATNVTLLVLVEKYGSHHP
jgi:membrane protease YdiL (CAAX protease family)